MHAANRVTLQRDRSRRRLDTRVLPRTSVIAVREPLRRNSQTAQPTSIPHSRDRMMRLSDFTFAKGLFLVIRSGRLIPAPAHCEAETLYQYGREKSPYLPRSPSSGRGSVVKGEKKCQLNPT